MSRTRTITITLGSIAAGAVLATGVTGLAFADDGSAASPQAGSATMLGGMQRGEHDGPHGRPGMHEGMHAGPMGQALHGETVVKAEDGTISTVRMVSGTVTAVSATSISVKAEDGYVGTFAVNADTEVHVGLPQRGQAPTTSAITDVSVGDVARVHGPVVGGTATAEDIHAMTAEQYAQLEAQRPERALGSSASPTSAQSSTSARSSITAS